MLSDLTYNLVICGNNVEVNYLTKFFGSSVITFHKKIFHLYF